MDDYLDSIEPTERALNRLKESDYPLHLGGFKFTKLATSVQKPADDNDG